MTTKPEWDGEMPVFDAIGMTLMAVVIYVLPVAVVVVIALAALRILGWF